MRREPVCCMKHKTLTSSGEMISHVAPLMTKSDKESLSLSKGDKNVE